MHSAKAATTLILLTLIANEYLSKGSHVWLEGPRYVRNTTIRLGTLLDSVPYNGNIMIVI